MSVQQSRKKHSTSRRSNNKIKKSAVHLNKSHSIDRNREQRFEKTSSKQRRQPTQKKGIRKTFRIYPKRIVTELSISLLILVFLLYVLSFFTFTVVKVEGYSMVPTLNNGEWLLVSKLARIKRHKMILYKDLQSKEISVRRVIGLPGEGIKYRDDKLYINDIEVYERFLETERRRAKSSNTFYTTNWELEQTSIPKGKYIILGDNRPYATDSRHYGYIDEKEIVGVVEMRIIPVHQLKQF